MQTSYIFYPKYGHEIVRKVLGCFINEFLNWHHNGYDWHITRCKDHEGWMVLEAYPEGSTQEYFSETCFAEDPLTAVQLTENMMVLLTEEGGPAYEHESEEGYSLYEVEIGEVVGALCKTGTRVYSPYSDKVWSFRAGPIDQRDARRDSMLDLLLSKETA